MRQFIIVIFALALFVVAKLCFNAKHNDQNISTSRQNTTVTRADSEGR